MGERIYLTAKQARELMLKSGIVRNRIDKLINEAAKEENAHGIQYWFNEYIDTQIKCNIINDLKDAGYSVNDIVDPDTGEEYNAIEICW